MATTIYFSKRFIKGILKGIKVTDKISFVDEKHAIDWVNGINKKSNLDYEIISFKMVHI